jgi:hypothetical protein
MLAYRHQFQVRETQILDVRYQRIFQLFPGEKTVVLFRLASPRAEMDFVSGDRRIQAVGGFAPQIAREDLGQVGDDRCGGGAQFGCEGVGIGAQRQDMAIRSLDLVLCI